MVHRMTFLTKATTAAILLIFSYHSVLLAKQVTVNVQSKDNQPIKDIVVYLMQTDGATVDYEGKEVVLYQEDKKFTPYITVKTPKDTLVFENRDTIRHHIFTVLSKELDFPLQKNERVTGHNITRLGDALLACNIHDWMAGYIFTVDTPYHGKSNANGMVQFSLPDYGEYKAIIWHPQLDKSDQSQTQVFLSDTTDSLTFQLTKDISEIPSQNSEEIFDFLDDY